MILANKIMNERKRNGWSQEELAEKLSVSRQSVSKWESAQAAPDLQKILMMAELFGVTTDYLLKDDQVLDEEKEESFIKEESKSEPPARKVSLEEANDFIAVSKRCGSRIANGVSMCIVSPVVVILLKGIMETGKYAIAEKSANFIGTLILLLLVAGAVALFIPSGLSLGRYEFLEKERIDTAYGVIGMVQEKKKALEDRRISQITLGVVLCILSVVPLVSATLMEMGDSIISFMVVVLLTLVAVAVNLFVRIGIEWSCYEKLLQERDYTDRNKKAEKSIGNIAGIYWGIITAGYLGYNSITGRWGESWIVWPVAGILFGVISSIVKMCMGGREE